jgi:hypothetical protein
VLFIETLILTKEIIKALPDDSYHKLQQALVVNPKVSNNPANRR